MPLPPDLTEEERAELERLLRMAIETSRFPLSARTRLHKAILAKLAGEPAKKPARPLSPVVGKKRHVFRDD